MADLQTQKHTQKDSSNLTPCCKSSWLELPVNITYPLNVYTDLSTDLGPRTLHLLRIIRHTGDWKHPYDVCGGRTKLCSSWIILLTVCNWPIEYIELNTRTTLNDFEIKGKHYG